MSDLLIKGMGKLKAGQMLQVAENWDGTLYVREMTQGEWCPLVEVPTHGPLIDASVLYDKTAELEMQARNTVGMCDYFENKEQWRKWSTILAERTAFKYDIADAPVVIESNKDVKQND